MMAMEADQRKGYAAKGAFNQTLIDFINGFENRYRDYENKKMELYKPFASHILDVYSNGNPKLTMETCTVLLQDMSSEKSISHDIVQSFINRVRNEDEHTDNDEKKSKSPLYSDAIGAGRRESLAGVIYPRIL